MRKMPPFYTSQLPSLDDCGPACATMVLKFLGIQTDIAEAKAYYDGLWNAYHFRLYLDRFGVQLTDSQNIVRRSNAINIFMSSFMFFNHWMIAQGSTVYCPIRGAMYMQQPRKGWPVMTALT